MEALERMSSLMQKNNQNIVLLKLKILKGQKVIKKIVKN